MVESIEIEVYLTAREIESSVSGGDNFYSFLFANVVSDEQRPLYIYGC